MNSREMRRSNQYNPGGALSRCIAVVFVVAASTMAQGKFTVQGEKIIGPDGRQFIAKGVNINGYQTNWRDESKTVGDLHLVKDVWKFNYLRLYCRLYKSASNQLGSKEDLYKIIDAYIKAHVVVMMTYHDHTGGLYTGSDLQDLISFNVAIVNRFKDHPDFTYLWFETMNEPGQKPLDDIDKMNRAFCTAVRDAGARDNIFCAPGNNYSQECNHWNSDPVTQSESYILSKGKAIQDWNQSKWGNRNVIFSPHFYRIWIHGDTKMARFIDDAYAQGLPLVVGEYGVGTNDKSTAEATKSLQRVGYSRKIGRCVWHWTGGDENDLTTSDQGRDINKTDGGKPTNLTWLGGVVWDDNHRTEDTGDPGNLAPQASFTFSGETRSAPATLSFDATGSSDADGKIASYSWDFGDGQSGSGRTASHTFTTGKSYPVKLTVTDDSGATATASQTVFVGPRTPGAMLVVGQTLLGGGDAAVKARLEAMDYLVDIVDDDAVSASAAGAADIVLVSSTCVSGAIGGALKDVAVPMIIWETYLYDDMGMTGATAGSDYGTAETASAVSIVNKSHILAADLAEGSVSVGSSIGWGNPGSAAAVVATVDGNASKAAVFAYEEGAAMVSGSAAARRVGFMLSDNTAEAMSDEGWQLFEAAVRWTGGTQATGTALGRDGGAIRSIRPGATRTQVRVMLDLRGRRIHAERKRHGGQLLVEEGRGLVLKYAR